MYENRSVHRFHGFACTDDNGSGCPFHDLDPAEPADRGSAAHFWNDGETTTRTEERTTESLFPGPRVMAQQTWEPAPLVGTYAECEPMIQRLGPAPS